MVSNQDLFAQIPYCLKGTNFLSLGQKYEGKVRDNYSKDGKRFIVVTDRLSAFDKVITLIPFKGQVLNQMAEFWFEKTLDIIGNHVIEFPDPNVVVAKECKAMPVEMVVRGYITGVTSTSVWTHYEKGERNFCGNVLPDGMKKNQKLEHPILTPSTKAGHGGHDESVSRDQVLERKIITAEQFDRMADAAMKLYQRGVEIAAKQGIILVDTKYEFGISPALGRKAELASKLFCGSKTPSGEILLIDEIHTPDSSRFWFADEYEKRFAAGEEQKKIDKEYLREWLAERGFRGEGEIPVIPDEIRVETARRYIEAYEFITGQKFAGEAGDVSARLQKNLSKYL